VTAATAASLVAMAARYSRGTWPEATSTVAQAEALRRRATKLASEDADALDAFLAARETPVDPRPEARDFHLGRTLDHAADVPLAIGETACDVALLAEHVADHGEQDVRPDVAAAAVLAHAAARAAAHLVEVNLAAGGADARVTRARELAAVAGSAADRAATPI
jgi:formiminotetrahydrofolate cyclodeaminase